MARTTALEIGYMPSLLDRLIDPESLGSGGTRGYTVAQLRDAVRRDLEVLFNTHTSAENIPAECREVRSSVATYGVPDVAYSSSRKGMTATNIARLIEEAILRHEPRLRDIRVVIAEADQSGQPVDSRIRLHIEAHLNLDPAPEVEFETVLELTTGQVSVAEGAE